MDDVQKSQPIGSFDEEGIPKFPETTVIASA